MSFHFEKLWELCEKLDQDNSLQSIIDELLMKINLYKTIDQKSIVKEEKVKAKFILYGEILLSLTRLSLIDDINVFDALMTVYKRRIQFKI